MTRYIFFQKAYDLDLVENWICILTLKQAVKKKKPSTLMQICAKQIFRLMSGIADQFFYHSYF